MYLRLLLTIFSILLFGVVSGQHYVIPTIKNEGTTIHDFIPEGWNILHSAYGDLNYDKYEDIAFVIQSKDSLESFTYHQSPETDKKIYKSEKYCRRILVIAFKDSLSDKFNLIEQNNSIILNHKDLTTDDPYSSIKIDSNLLKIEYHIKNKEYGYVINSTYFFSYRGGIFSLIEVDKYSFYESSPMFENNQFDFLNQKWSITKGNRNDLQNSKTDWKPLNKIELKTFKTFTRPYTWNVTEDIYL